MADGINISKANVLTVLGPTDLSVSKANLLAVTSPPYLSVSKSSLLAVVRDVVFKGSCTGSGSLYLSGDVNGNGRLIYTYEGSGEVKFTGQSVSSGRFIGIPTCSGTFKLAGLAKSYNVVAVPNPYNSHSRTIDVDTVIDAIDLGLQPTAGGVGGPGMGVETFWVSMFILDTDDYDGTVVYKHQIIAKNTDAAERTISIINGTDTIDEIIVPSGTTQWTMFTSTFTPLAGSNKYYWKVPCTVSVGYSEVIARTGRILVNQTEATKTLIWRPVADCTYDSHWAYYLDIQLPRLWGYYGPEDFTDIGWGGTWYWDTSIHEADSMSVILEACCGGGSVDTVSEVRLYDITADEAVAGSNFFVSSGGGILDSPNANVERHEMSASLLTNGHLYKMQYRLYDINGSVAAWILGSARFQRGAFYVKLNGIKKCEVVYRVAKSDGSALLYNDGSSRVRIDSLGENTQILYVKNETCSKSTGGVVDYWVTDDGHEVSGNGASATIIPDSNAHQDLTTTLLPIFSGDWKSNYTPSDTFCMRQVHASGGGASSIWTLICLGLQSSYVYYDEPYPCTICVEREDDTCNAFTRTQDEVACLTKQDDEYACLRRVTDEFACVTRIGDVCPIIERNCETQ